jgi:hypothetical protein
MEAFSNAVLYVGVKEKGTIATLKSVHRTPDTIL